MARKKTPPIGTMKPETTRWKPYEKGMVEKGLEKIGLGDPNKYKSKRVEPVKRAKGGSIDGAAIRGKTRAKRK